MLYCIHCGAGGFRALRDFENIPKSIRVLNRLAGQSGYNKNNLLLFLRSSVLNLKKKVSYQRLNNQTRKNRHISSCRQSTRQQLLHITTVLWGKSLPDSKDLIRPRSKGAAYSHTSSSFHLKPFSKKTQIQTESGPWSEGSADVQELLPVGCTRMTCARVSDWANLPRLTSICRRRPPPSAHVTAQTFQGSRGATQTQTWSQAAGKSEQVSPKTDVRTLALKP